MREIVSWIVMLLAMMASSSFAVIGWVMVDRGAGSEVTPYFAMAALCFVIAGLAAYLSEPPQVEDQSWPTKD